VTHIVLLYALFNTTCVIAAPLVGRLGDKVGRSRIVVLGYAVYALINAWLVIASSRWEMVAVFAVYGLFYAIEESQSKAFMADLEPERRATAMGVYNAVTGALYLPASLVAGALWTIAPGLAFGAAAALALLAMVAFAVVGPAD
jgi:MFS family permease